MNPDRSIPDDWYPGNVPENVTVHPDAYLESSYSFELFRSQTPEAIRIGRGSSIYQGVMFDLGKKAQVRIGEFSLMNGGRIICESDIEVGDYCLISWSVVLMDSYRVPQSPAARRRQLEAVGESSPRQLNAPAEARPIRIGNNVWIGFESCVLPGVSIGEGSVVGARSVVTEDIPPFSVAVGNPARVIRKLTPDEAKPPV
jgi:acetyltransferase-like isoleucine patch superfamily enzyme